MVLGPSANLSRRTVLLSGWLLGYLGLVANAAETITPLVDRDLVAAVESIRVEDLKIHISTLASDALQGREAGTTGGHAASAYLMQQLRRHGVAPAAADGRIPPDAGPAPW